MSNQWFRLYSEIIDDEKIRMLAFEDRWHYIAILSCKNLGIIDSNDDVDFLNRRLGVKLGLQKIELENLKKRLMEVKLIDENWQPMGWDKRQFYSDSSAERTRKYREKIKENNNLENVTSQKRHGDALEQNRTDTDTEIKEKNNKKEKSEIEKKNKPSPGDEKLLSEFGITGDLAKDFLKHRQRHKAAITKTALDGFSREAKKAGITIAQAITISIERNWQGFKHDWINQDFAGNGKYKTTQDKRHERDIAFNRELYSKQF